MTLNPTSHKELSDSQVICLSSAMVGLVGSATAELSAWPKVDALRVFELVSRDLASLAWTVTARSGFADVRLDLVHVDGRREHLADHRISLELRQPVPTSPAPGSLH